MTSPGLASFIYGYSPFGKGMPLTQPSERGYARDFLASQGVVVDSNMYLPNLTHVKDFAWYAAANGCSDGQLKGWDCKACQHVPGAKFVGSFFSYVTGAQGYLAIDKSRRRIICSFRGTMNSRNRVASVDLYGTRFPYSGEFETVVADGYLRSLESLDFITPLKGLLAEKRYKNYMVSFIGHSLGGAIASLAAAKAHSQLDLNWSQMELYTYGQPRTGNVKFAEWYDKQPLASARVVNNTDPFPHLTTSLFTKYKHHQNELWIKGAPSNYTLIICSNDQLEDPDCSNSVSLKQYTKADHLIYFEADLLEKC